MRREEFHIKSLILIKQGLRNEKIFFRLISLICGTLGLQGCNSGGYVPYVPVTIEIVNGEPEHVEKPELNSRQHQKNIAAILAKYGEKFLISDGGNVLIKARLAKDADLLANYTKKALEMNSLEKQAG